MDNGFAGWMFAPAGSRQVSEGTLSYMRHMLLLIVVLTMAGCDQSQPEPEDQTVDPRTAILDRIGDINDFSRPRPLVSLELFFEGNDDPGAIGYNLADPPEPREFYDLLKRLRSRDDVHDILIEVKDIEDPEGWPSTDTIWFMTTATPEEVRSWFPQRLAPSEMVDGFDESVGAIEPYEVPNGYRAVAAWYD